MAKKILIYTGSYPNGGIGNVFRMMILARYLLANDPDLHIDFVLNKNGRMQGFQNILSGFNIILLNNVRGIYSIILYDSIVFSENELQFLKKKANKIIAFDFFEYNSEEINIIINLYNHFPDKINQFNGKIFTGVQYAILRDEIIELKKNSFHGNTNKALISFGGEDPNSNSLKVLNALKKLKEIEITCIIGNYNRDKEKILKYKSDKIHVINHVDNIADYYKNHEIMFVGGGTSLLEVLYLNKIIIAVPQNAFEADFIKSLKKKEIIYSLSDTIKRPSFENFKCANSEIIDGKGKERIRNIIYSK
jgi:spore coat polysaccharide biosynthesis predicted glycosyltransferase SpsG